MNNKYNRKIIKFNKIKVNYNNMNKKLKQRNSKIN